MAGPSFTTRSPTGTTLKGGVAATPYPNIKQYRAQKGAIVVSTSVQKGTPTDYGVVKDDFEKVHSCADVFTKGSTLIIGKSLSAFEKIQIQMVISKFFVNLWRINSMRADVVLAGLLEIQRPLIQFATAAVDKGRDLVLSTEVYKGVDWKAVHSVGSDEKNRPFSHLSRDELRFLSGRIGIIELQEGCWNQCVGCGVDAPRVADGQTMKFESAERFFREIKRLREEAGLKLLSLGKVMLFRASDLLYYRSKDKDGNYRTFADVVRRLFIPNTEKEKFSLTTAGWLPGNNYRESTMRAIIEDVKDGKYRISLMYSVKPFGKMIRQEYDAFIDRTLDAFFRGEIDLGEGFFMKTLSSLVRKVHGGRYRSSPSAFKFVRENLEYPPTLVKDESWFDLLMGKNIGEFIKTSKYVEMVVSNLNLLDQAQLEYTDAVNYYDGELVYDVLPDEFARFGEMFSRRFVDELMEYVDSKRVVSKSRRLSKRSHVAFGPVGRAVEDLGLSQERSVQVKISDLKNRIIDRFMELFENYGTILSPLSSKDGSMFVSIGPDGKINIVHAPLGPSGLDQILLPREFFIELAEFFESREEIESDQRYELGRQYRVLAELQGKNVFPDYDERVLRSSNKKSD